MSDFKSFELLLPLLSAVLITNTDLFSLLPYSTQWDTSCPGVYLAVVSNGQNYSLYVGSAWSPGGLA
jgi:hypothetical protein